MSRNGGAQAPGRYRRAVAEGGAGWLSLDHVIGYPISGWVAFAVCVGAGVIGAALTLLTSWRPAPTVTEPAAAEPTTAA